MYERSGIGHSVHDQWYRPRLGYKIFSKTEKLTAQVKYAMSKFKIFSLIFTLDFNVMGLNFDWGN